MMVTIHGLPVNIKYQDLKVIIKQECKIVDFILDNLVTDTDGLKKVRVGLADDSEGAHVIKCLDGYRLSKYVLRVKPVGKSGIINQPDSNQRGFPQQPYQQQSQPEYGRQEPRVDPWSQSQWSQNQQMGSQNTYNYQAQPVNSYAPTAVNQQLQPQYDQRQSILSRIGPPSQGFSIAPKNEIPTQNAPLARQGVLRNIELVDTPVLNRPTNYDVRRQEIPRDRAGAPDRADILRRSEMARTDLPRDRNVIMKDHFQGPQYSASQKGPGLYPERDPWGQPGHQKPESHVKPFEKPYIDDRKFPDKRDILKEPLIKHSGSYKEYDKSQFSPQDRIPPHLNRNIRGNHPSPPGRRISPNGGPFSPSGRRISPSSRRISPSSRRNSPIGRRISPPGKRMHPSEGMTHERRFSPGRHGSPHRRYSPSGRRISPPGRRISPTERRISPSGRRISPSGRRISPPGRRISPSGRRISPPGRRISPSGRRVSPSGGILAPSTRRSPIRRISPVKRSIPGHHSPGRRDDVRRPGQERYSPSHIDDGRLKQVRPAYEPPASNQAMYSGGYRANVTDTAQYPHGRQERSDRYVDREKPYKQDDDRREARMSKFDAPRNDHPRVEPEIKRPSAPQRDSRSPRRDRSPIRDRYRRHSPSPRSPRRSWALEKRRSPDDSEAPPPPSWPGQEPGRASDSREKRPYPNRGDDHPPSWERPKFDSKAEDIRREPRPVAEDKREYDREPVTIRKNLLKWKPIGSDPPKLGPSCFDQNNEREKRKEYDSRQHDYRPSEEERRPRSDRREFEHRHEEDRRYKSEYSDPTDFKKLKEELSRRIEKKTEILKKQEELQKEIEDVYKRAVDFTKKAELYKKGERRRGEDYREERRRDDRDVTRFDRHAERADDDRRRDDTANKPHPERYREDARQEKRIEEDKPKPKPNLNSNIRPKREKAGEEIAKKILDKHGEYLPKDISRRVLDELKFAVLDIFNAMYGTEDVSFIEMVVKFNSRHSAKDEEQMFDEVMKSFPSQYRKRPAKDESGIPPKVAKPSPSETVTKDETTVSTYQIPNWNYSYGTTAPVIHQMVPNPFMSQQYVMPMQQFVQTYTELVSVPAPVEEQPSPEPSEYTLYLCKDDFQPINGSEADALKEHIIQQMISVTQGEAGWAPDFTIKGLQSPFRYEVVARDMQSKDWLVNLDFSIFSFNILVYTKEELWYERAAIWLPGHSKCYKPEPLVKLKLQNRHLEGVNIHTWKLVKKIVTANGTRVYVDMPPSSARALEKHKMMLSYELQKVNIFLKAVAVDKNAFDAGLKEVSLKFVPAPQNSAMPSLQHDPNAVKFSLGDDKPISLSVARNIKDAVIRVLFRYLQSGGTCRTDFTKFGFINPGYFGVLPENHESKQWLMSTNFYSMKNKAITVIGADENTRFIKMYVHIPSEGSEQSPVRAIERLRNSNQGVKGINFHKWKNAKVHYDNMLHRMMLVVDMDLESVETIININYQLDYVGDNNSGFRTLKVRAENSNEKLEEMVKKYKEESSDKYVVANMEITDNSDDSDDDVVCIS